MNKLSVPFFKQDTLYTCGPTSLQMVLAYYGVRDSEARLGQLLNTNKEIGTARVEMYQLALDFGFHCYVNNEADNKEIDFLLKLNIPPIIRFIEPASEEDHYGVVVGYSEKEIVIHDPWNGPEQTYNHAEFLERWKCQMADCRRWLMAVSPDPLPLGKQFHPHGKE